MYNGIGLTTPRGSGTNGYVQKNASFFQQIKPKINYKDPVAPPPIQRTPNREIIEHEKKKTNRGKITGMGRTPRF